MSLDNPIEIPMKKEAKRLGYWLRRLPESDAWYQCLGPYYLVHRGSSRVKYQRLTLNDVFGILTTINHPRKRLQ